jgi:hypothetical protein
MIEFLLRLWSVWGYRCICFKLSTGGGPSAMIQAGDKCCNSGGVKDRENFASPRKHHP